MPPLPAPDPTEPEVADFLHDAVSGLLQPIPSDHPADILWIDYACEEDSASGELVVTGTMKVSGLDPVPPQAVWRLNFTANAAGGVSDRGDQFFLRGNSNDGNAPTFTWGTAVRNPSGSLTYTTRGDAGSGAIDPAAGTITVRAAVTALNGFVTHGPAIGPGSVFHGLRGETFLGGSNAADYDQTRGGTSFECPPTAGLTAAPIRKGVTPWARAPGTPIRVASGDANAASQTMFRTRCIHPACKSDEVNGLVKA